MTRKEAILKAAIQLFAQRGFHATSTSEVAKRAGVAEGTIFHYFKTKEGILMYLFEEIMDSYTEGIENILKKATSGMEAIEELIRFHFRFGEQRSQELKVVMRDFPSNLIEFGSPFREKVTERLSRIMDVTKECIERGLKDGSIRDLSPEETSFIIQGILIGVSRLKLMGPLRVPNLSSQVIDLCRRGLAKPN